MQDKLCKDCTHIMDTKPLPKCGASRFKDLVDGTDKRSCLIERIDGIGRCGAMGNNYSVKKPEPPKPEPEQTKPEVEPTNSEVETKPKPATKKK